MQVTRQKQHDHSVLQPRLRGQQADRGATAQPHRCGLTLLEVVLAIAILLAAGSAIGRLMHTGAQASQAARLQSDALRRCESTISEIVAGRRPLRSEPDSVCADDAAWSCEVAVDNPDTARSGQTVPAGLRLVTVTLRRRNAGDRVVSISTLSRLVLTESADSAERPLAQDAIRRSPR